jgi:hypothetical protein
MKLTQSGEEMLVPLGVGRALAMPPKMISMLAASIATSGTFRNCVEPAQKLLPEQNDMFTPC